MYFFRIVLYSLLVNLFIGYNLSAQSAPTAFEFIELNNIYARINSGGDHFMDFMGGPQFEVPKNSGKHTIGAFGLWIGGIDLNNQLHLAGQLYRENGCDFYTGPLSTDGLAQTNEYTSAIWDKLWVVSRQDVTDHQLNYQQVGYIPPEDLEEWPVHGDASLNHPLYIAPFIDQNLDGIYDCYDGDYPAVRGDITLFHVYNDNADIHTQTDGMAIGVEVQSMVYAFNCPLDSVFNNTIFIKLTIINRSDWELHDSYLGFFVDFEIGYDEDDYIGCDTLLNSIFGYNGINWDPVYGEHPPAQAMCILNDTIDRFIYMNDQSAMNDPDAAPEYYNYMRGKWRDGTVLVFGGNGHVNTGGIDTAHYAFPGDPNDPDGWSEVSAGNIPHERKGLVSFGPFTLLPDMTKEIDLAFIFARDYQGTNLSSVSMLKQRIEQLKTYYNENTTPCGSSWSGVSQNHSSQNSFQVYPIPAKSKLNIISQAEDEKYQYEILDNTGLIAAKGTISFDQKAIDISNLSAGYYFIKFKLRDRIEICKFVKY